MRTVAIEEAYATEAFIAGPGQQLLRQAEAARDHPLVAGGTTELVDRLQDLGSGRIAAMDEGGVDVQVLSLTAPGVEQLPASSAVADGRDADDLGRRAYVVSASFAAAALPSSDPGRLRDAAYGPGARVRVALINGPSHGRYLDDRFFWPILSKPTLSECRCTCTPPRHLPRSGGDLSRELSRRGRRRPRHRRLGMAVDTALHLLRVIVARLGPLALAAVHCRAHGRGSTVHAAPARAGSGSPLHSSRPVLVPTCGKHPLHTQRFHLHGHVPEPVAGGRRGPIMLPPIPVRLDDRGASLPRPAAVVRSTEPASRTATPNGC